jgi:hypothetical protein
MMMLHEEWFLPFRYFGKMRACRLRQALIARHHVYWITDK